LQRTANQREAGQSSWVELCRYKRALNNFINEHLSYGSFGQVSIINGFK